MCGGADDVRTFESAQGRAGRDRPDEDGLQPDRGSPEGGGAGSERAHAGGRGLTAVPTAHGLEAIDAVGKRFDPKLHEAVGHEESLEHPEDTVVSELRRGYRIRDRVVRPALVKLARRPELPAESSSGSESVDGNPKA